MQSSIKPWLWLPPTWAHNLSPVFLKLYEHFFEGQPFIWKSLVWKNLVFKNPLGLAGGVDKNAEFLKAWWSMGAGFIEVGTVTPEAQTPNPGKILDRNLKNFSLWNRMGFPSHGMDEVFFNLRTHYPFQTPVFVNVGKNRWTPNEKAFEDYLAVFERLQFVTDAFVINISSPNTQGLRDLGSKDNLKKFLDPLISFRFQTPRRPILLKLSPDMNDADFAQNLLTASECGIDGFVLTNTTLDRPEDCLFPKEGGVSGLPLKSRSIEILKLAIQTLGSQRKDKLIVSVGGILTPEDIEERLKLGADLVQVYSALIFEGFGFFKDAAQYFQNRELKAPASPGNGSYHGS